MKQMIATGLGLLFGTTVYADEPLYIPPSNLNQPCVPCGPCLPGGSMGLPIGPTTPGMLMPGTTQPPGTISPNLNSGGAGTPLNTDSLQSTPTPQSNVPTTDANFAFQSAPAAGTGSSASIAPNLMGDLIGARSLTVGFRRQLTATFPNPPSNSPGSFLAVPSTATFNLDPLPGLGGGNFMTGPLSQLGRLDPFTQNTVGQSAQIAASDAFVTQAILQSAFSGQPLNPQAAAMLPANVRAQLPLIQGSINQELTRATNGLTLPNVTVSNVQGNLVTTDQETSALQYTALLTGQTSVPLPGSSSVVGRVKLSEVNNPMPRDRIIFNYDYFDSVPFIPQGIAVNRFHAGFEKTFLDGRASFEMLLPFAGTLASTTTQGFEVRDTELGNLRLALKYLWTQNPYVNFSSGVGVTLPTADDTVVNSVLGNQLYRFENDSVTVEPFVAALFTPTDRLFGQLWSSVNFDTTGGTLIYDRSVFGGSGRSEFIDLPILAIDGQVGYWVYRNNCGTVRGLAPFVELHYNQIIAQDQVSDSINNRTQSQGLDVSTIGNTELNLTAGVTTQIGDNLFLTLGGAAPLLQNPDRTFNGQFGLRLNYLYGRSAAPSTARGYSPSGF